METSNIAAVATNGIVPLSGFEIEMVSGGKSAVQKILESLMNWFDGLGGQPSVPSGGGSITPADVITLQDACLAAGGDFSFSTGYADVGVNLRVTGVDGSYSWVNIQCTTP